MEQELEEDETFVTISGCNPATVSIKAPGGRRNGCNEVAAHEWLLMVAAEVQRATAAHRYEQLRRRFPAGAARRVHAEFYSD